MTKLVPKDAVAKCDSVKTGTTVSAHFLKVGEVAAELNLGERSVWRLIEDGELPTYRFGHSRRVRQDDLDAYISRSRK